MTDVILEDEAALEVIRAFDWYEEQNEGVGTRLLEAIDSALASLPRRWPKMKLLPDYESLGVRFAEVSKPWPYRLLVVEEAGKLHVVAVAHDSREPGYWRHRLGR